MKPIVNYVFVTFVLFLFTGCAIMDRQLAIEKIPQNLPVEELECAIWEAQIANAIFPDNREYKILNQFYPEVDTPAITVDEKVPQSRRFWVFGCSAPPDYVLEFIQDSKCNVGEGWKPCNKTKIKTDHYTRYRAQGYVVNNEGIGKEFITKKFIVLNLIETKSKEQVEDELRQQKR